LRPHFSNSCPVPDKFRILAVTNSAPFREKRSDCCNASWGRPTSPPRRARDCWRPSLTSSRPPRSRAFPRPNGRFSEGRCAPDPEPPAAPATPRPSAARRR